MKNKNRTGQINCKATPETKEKLELYKKQTNQSPADVLEMATNKLTYGEHVAIRLKVIEEELDMLTELVETLNTKIDKLTDEMQTLKLSKKGKEIQDKSKEERTIETVKSYYHILESQTTPFGLRKGFDKELVGTNLCTKQNSDYALFQKIVNSIESGKINLERLNVDVVEEVLI